jgi:hypothetical protein
LRGKAGESGVPGQLDLQRELNLPQKTKNSKMNIT